MLLAGGRRTGQGGGMATHIALLRGINVGGNRLIPMESLRAFFAGLGLTGARTLLQSGNVVFQSGARPGALERRLEAESEKRLGLEAEFFVRTAQEWKAIVAGNPFPAEARTHPGLLVVMFLKRAPEPERFRALTAAITGPEIVRPAGRQAYVFYPAGSGNSRLTSSLIDRTLATRGTGRNWNTVLKLDALAGTP
jgi:uncharacterized protein (DUF1697 family)